MLGTILLVAIVVLLMVVLIPVSLALYQRLRIPTDESGGVRRSPAPPSPAIPPQKTTPPAAAVVQPKVPSQPPAASPPAQSAVPAPREPVASMGDATVFIPKDDQAPAPTEQLRWNGLLLCTAGALEGQRFIIEDDGFYIGRDPVLSQVVINDTRISKRHVRIVPRDGRVHAIDQSSTNGTFLRSAKGDERITDVQLKRGETVVLADNVATFVYQI